MSPQHMDETRRLSFERSSVWISGLCTLLPYFIDDLICPHEAARTAVISGVLLGSPGCVI